ncbi:penicillin-binding protein [Wenyingzhuangia marina]|uniref:Cell division protein FtsI (Penicillin-binding protein 3) n=1 Tax=Wenyingzhuangia marina TaxID=1195760 RepID=A0A1M5SGE0_9FLAO|nr:penicillin-binding protein [Wenyingzhuangia marina]GGF62112.1 penicillin-binding protein [Wenyingzhuangia marina]SHH37551.1 cell division protein FtsI (penicillin-binding protein 3) [Wenyingzhuangia marina]
MSTTEKSIVDKLGWLVLVLAVLFVVLIVRVGFIQSVEGEYYRKISVQRTIKTDTIFANRGNIYATGGNLLATTMSKYTVRLDMVTIENKVFEENINALSDSLSVLFKKPSSYYRNYLRTGKRRRNRYLFLARDLGYIDYARLKTFPILKLGQYRGGLITEQRNVRARPLGNLAVRTVGYSDYRGNVGVEGAYINYLKEHHGWRQKQRIAKGQWKPINDKNEKEPQDGSDVITTIDVNIQDVVHAALLEQLETFEADHGCAMVMETKTGEIRAIVNLGKYPNGNYFEKRNYAIYEAQEPGSTFKLASLLVGLEDKKVDTGDVVDTEKGVMKVYGRSIIDSHRGGYGKISLARAIEVSSNVGIAKMVMESYKSNPQQFVDGINKLGFGEKIGVPIKGEGQPFIPNPKYVKRGDPNSWNGLSLAWMAWGYGVKVTPLQLLTFYNAIANDGVMVKPRFIKELRNQGEVEKVFESEVLNDKIASEETINKLQEILKNVVIRGTGEKLYSPSFSMAGKTGTCQTEYWTGNTQYVSSFTGFFPAENPKYTCVVVVNKPNKHKGYYGATVAAPVFKAIAQKIYASSLQEKEVTLDLPKLASLESDYQEYQKENLDLKSKMPDVRGMALMDAVSVLENKGLLVDVQGGLEYVKKQSITKGVDIKRGQQVVLY